MERNRLWKATFQNRGVILWGGSRCCANRDFPAQPHPRPYWRVYRGHFSMRRMAGSSKGTSQERPT